MILICDQAEQKISKSTLSLPSPKVLPWKRDPNPDSCLAPMKQREFPSWLKNEHYMVHGSPVDVDTTNGKALSTKQLRCHFCSKGPYT